MKYFQYMSGSIAALVGIILVALPFYFNVETQALNKEQRALAPGDFIESSHGLTHYEDSGPRASQTVLLVHGFSVPYYIWEPTFNALVKNGFRVIRYDIYGRGYSSRPDLAYNRELFLEQIDTLLLALEVTEPIHIVGLSMGGPIVADYTTAHPKKVRKVVLIDPAHEAAKISLLALPFIGEYIMNILIAPSMPDSQISDFYRPENHPDWADKFKVQMQYSGFKRAILSTRRNYSDDKLLTYIELGSLNKPVMLIWGKEDQTVPFEGNKRIRAVVKTEFLRVDEAAHLPHYEEPVLVNTRIVSFLND